MAYQAELAVLERQVHEEKRARQIAEQFLNAQRQLVQNAGRELQEAVFQEKNCQHKIAEAVSSTRLIDDNIVELKAHLEKLQAEQMSFDETQLNSLLQERLEQRDQREQRLGWRAMRSKRLRVNCAKLSRRG